MANILDKLKSEGGIVDLYHVCSRTLYVWHTSQKPLTDAETKEIIESKIALKRNSWVEVSGDFGVSSKQFKASGALLTI